MRYYKGRRIDQELCSKCQSEPRQNGQRWGNKCRAEYMREWRKENPLTSEQKKKDNCRSYANVYQRRGKLLKQPCSICGSTEKIEKHHEDYSKPLEVVWLCRKCHTRKAVK